MSYWLSELAVAGDNFNVEYLKINPKGTVPSLVVRSESNTLTDSRDILDYLDQVSASSRVSSLTPFDAAARVTMDAIIELVHSNDADTNLILLQARDLEEYQEKQSGPFGAYIAVRQTVLEGNHATYPEYTLYGSKAKENGVFHKIYTTGPGIERDAFFESTRNGYRKFSRAMDRLESLLVLPYAVGDDITRADLNAIPWLAHAMAGVGTKEIKDLSKLQAHVQKTVPGFAIGPKTQRWWYNYTERDSFKEVFPVLH